MNCTPIAMLTICFYLSDYGFGHASRAIAIVRALQRSIGDLRIIIKAAGTYDFLRAALDCEVVYTRNDVGVVLRSGTLAVDRDATERIFRQWVATWPEYIRREEQFLTQQRVDLILSDIVPQSFIAASCLGIPSVAVSNFTWYSIYHHLFGSTAETEAFAEAYSHAHRALVLPFQEPMRNAHGESIFADAIEVPLVSREITEGRVGMRERYGISPEDLLIFLNAPLTPSLLKGLQENEITVLVPSNVSTPAESVIPIWPDETESHNCIAMCDLVVSKAGYSTVSEAVRAKVPIRILRREGFAEDPWIIKEVEALGVGQEVPIDEYLSGNWISECADTALYQGIYDHLPARYDKNGVDTIEHEIIRLLS